MIITKDRQIFARSVGILFALQGLTWFALAISGLIVMYSPPTSLTETNITGYTKYSQYLGRIIYNDFMVENQTRSRVIRPTDFAAFLWIYVILSAIWVTASLDQNIAIKYKKHRQSHIALVLGVSTLLISLLDLVFFSLLARDYATCPFDLGTSTTEATTITTTEESASSITAVTISESTSQTADSDVSSYLQLLSSASSSGTLIDCQVANGIVMSLAARGYVLWAVNVVFGLILISIGSHASRVPRLLRYGNKSIPRAKLPDQRKPPSPIDDLVFYDDNDRFGSPVAPPKEPRSRLGTPVARYNNNKNQNIYF